MVVVRYGVCSFRNWEAVENIWQRVIIVKVVLE